MFILKVILAIIVLILLVALMGWWGMGWCKKAIERITRTG